jgi:uncharacterized protein (TIGR03435 family)
MNRLIVVLYLSASTLVGQTLLSSRLQAQTAPAESPRFEVTSVKQSLSESQDSKLSSTLPDRFVATNYPLFFLVQYAYDLKGHQLIGAPDWTWDKTYDLVGTYPATRPAEADVRVMLQNLLADRFGLKLHTEQREVPAYDLVLARKDGRLGPQLVRSNVDCVAWMKLKHSRIDAGGPSPVSASGKRPECMIITTRKYMTGGATTIHEFAGPLEAILDKPVVDKTGLTGAYDIDLQWDPAGMYVDRPSTASYAPSSAEAPSAPSIFTAVEEQLGLKLVPSKEKLTVFVVDQIKPPDPN